MKQDDRKRRMGFQEKQRIQSKNKSVDGLGHKIPLSKGQLITFANKLIK